MGSSAIGMSTFSQKRSHSDRLALLRRVPTPFVPPGHPKRDRAAFVSREVGRELASRDITTPVIVAERNRDWRSYIRSRPAQHLVRSVPDRGAASTGAFLELTFDAPVSGPLALGYLSHFGLGLFRPDERG